MSDESRDVWVSIEAEATEEEIDAIAAVFARYGLKSEINAGLLRLSQGPLPWALEISVVLTSFLSAFGAAAGGDTWRGLKALVAALYAARRGRGKPDGVIKLHADGGRLIQLDDDLPDVAYEEIEEGRLDRRGLYVWDPERQGWKRISSDK